MPHHPCNGTPVASLPWPDISTRAQANEPFCETCLRLHGAEPRSFARRASYRGSACSVLSETREGEELLTAESHKMRGWPPTPRIPGGCEPHMEVAFRVALLRLTLAWWSWPTRHGPRALRRAAPAEHLRVGGGAASAPKRNAALAHCRPQTQPPLARSLHKYGIPMLSGRLRAVQQGKAELVAAVAFSTS